MLHISGLEIIPLDIYHYMIDNSYIKVRELSILCFLSKDVHVLIMEVIKTSNENILNRYIIQSLADGNEKRISFFYNILIKHDYKINDDTIFVGMLSDSLNNKIFNDTQHLYLDVKYNINRYDDINIFRIVESMYHEHLTYDEVMDKCLSYSFQGYIDIIKFIKGENCNVKLSPSLQDIISIYAINTDNIELLNNIYKSKCYIYTSTYDSIITGLILSIDAKNYGKYIGNIHTESIKYYAVSVYKTYIIPLSEINSINKINTLILYGSHNYRRKDIEKYNCSSLVIKATKEVMLGNINIINYIDIITISKSKAKRRYLNDYDNDLKDIILNYLI